MTKPSGAGIIFFVFKDSRWQKRLNRREQYGWTEAKNTNQDGRSPYICVLSRREAVRREQVKRDNAVNPAENTAYRTMSALFSI